MTEKMTANSMGGVAQVMEIQYITFDGHFFLPLM